MGWQKKKIHSFGQISSLSSGVPNFKKLLWPTVSFFFTTESNPLISKETLDSTRFDSAVVPLPPCPLPPPPPIFWFP